MGSEGSCDVTAYCATVSPNEVCKRYWKPAVNFGEFRLRKKLSFAVCFPSFMAPLEEGVIDGWKQALMIILVSALSGSFRLRSQVITTVGMGPGIGAASEMVAADREDMRFGFTSIRVTEAVVSDIAIVVLSVEC